MKKPLFIVIATLVSLNASAQYSDTIHLENNHGHFYFNATINDSIDGRFLFDTGAGAALFDVNFLQSVYTPQVVHPVTMNGMGNKVVEAYYTPDTLKMTFGAVSTLIDFTVLVNFDSLVPLKCDGIVGPRNFEKMIYQIDLSNHRVVLYPDMSLIGNYRAIPYTSGSDGFITVEIEAIIDSLKNKIIKEKVHLDTGNPLTVDFLVGEKQSAQLMSKIDRYTSVHYALRGVGGGGLSYIAALQAIRIGGYFVPARHASVMIDNVANEGILGNEIMEQFDLIVDAPNKLLYLKPNKNFGTIIAPDYRGYFLAPNFEDQMVINGLIENYKGALKVGDVVTHIDGKSFDQMSYKEHKSYCSTPDLTHTITIIRQGSPLTITTTNLNDTTLWQ